MPSLGESGWSQTPRASQGSLGLSLPRATVSSWQNLLLQLALSAAAQFPLLLFPRVQLPRLGAGRSRSPRPSWSHWGKLSWRAAAEGFLPVTPPSCLPLVPPEWEGIPFSPFQVGRACDHEEKGQHDVRTISLDAKEMWISLIFMFISLSSASSIY